MNDGDHTRQPSRWSSLQWQLPIAIFVLLMVSLAIVLIAVDIEGEDTFSKAATERARGAGEQIAAFMGPSVVAGVAQLDRTANSAAIFQEYLAYSDPAVERDVRKTLAGFTSPPPRRVALWAVDGRSHVEELTVAPGRPPLPPITLPTQAGIGAFSVVDDAVILDLVIAVRDPTTTITLGFLVVRTTLAINPPGIIGRLIGTDARATVGNRDGRGWVDLSVIRTTPRPPIDLARTGAAAYRDPSGATWVGTLTAVAGTPWSVWVEFPRSAVVAQARALVERLTALSLIFLAVAVVLVWFLKIRVTAPLATLSAATAAIAGGNYSRRVGLTASNEIGRLGRDFDAMATKVEEGRRELEARVDDRTHALNDALAALKKRTEAQEAYLAAIVDSSGDAIIGQTLDLTVQSVNAAAEELYGYAADELIGHSSRRLTPPDRHADIDAVIVRVRAGERVRALETVRLAKDGTPIPVSMTISPIADTRGRIVGLASVARDIRERKRLEEQLFQSQKMEAIGQLAGGVAHDFNNLLTAIIGFAQLTVEDLAPNDPHRADLEEVLKAGERAASLTNQLLAFSRKQVVQPTLVNVNTLVTDLSKMLRRLIGEDIDLDLRLEPALGTVRADAGQLDQIVVNLSVNARDAMPSGGRLTIETANTSLDASFIGRHGPVRAGPYVMIAVMDTGVGMSPETHAHLFEPFFTTKGPGKGTGLGLATVYGIVHQNEGHVYVYSEPGHGATFKIFLPRVADAESAAAPRTEAAVGGSETVLLVEDDRAVRLLARTMLEEAGYRVIEAVTPLDALTKLDERPVMIDLLVTDVILPGVSGPALFNQMAATRPDLKVVYVSGYTDHAAFRVGQLDAGAAFLQKPFGAHDLLRKVRAVLDGPP